MKKSKVVLCSFVILIFYGTFLNVKLESTKKIENIIRNERNFKKKVYENCITTPFISMELNEKIPKLLNEYQDIGLSFSFEEIKNNYSFGLREEQIFYGASIIKLLEVVYLLNNKISLEEEISYQKKHQKNYSLEMQEKNLGEKIKIKDLIKYMLKVSDNTAHEMLLEYIGIENLKQFANTLGITLTINPWDHYGNLSSKDGIKILKEIYKILTLENEYTILLKDSMNNNYFNSLNFEEKKFYHKYGFYDIYYHDIGIYKNQNPYLISIFTANGQQNYHKIVQELNKKIYNIYQLNIVI